jgi:trk system potassium uptake protein
MQVIVIGCGKVGSSLATVLVDRNHDVVVVEQDTELLQSISDLDCIKVTGVPIDRDILKQAGIETADVVCAVTQNDNINIMVAQIADLIFNVPQIIARIYNPVSRSVFEAFGINAVCSTDLTVQDFLRRIGGEKEGKQQRVFDNDVVFTSVPIDPELAGEDIANLSTDTGKHIFGVLRKGQLLMAVPGTQVKTDDELVLADLQ